MKILLVDDHVLFRAGLRMLLATLQAELAILEADDCRDALAAAQANPDIRLCLLDLHLRDASGLDALSAVSAAAPGVTVVVLSGDEHPAAIRRALDGGAMGYIPKSSSPEIMTRALQLVLAGGTYLPPGLLDGARALARPAARAGLGITGRQHEVLQCLVRGLPNKAICRELAMSEGTVKAHLRAIYRALRVSTRAQAVIEAGRLGVSANFRRAAEREHGAA